MYIHNLSVHLLRIVLLLAIGIFVMPLSADSVKININNNQVTGEFNNKPLFTYRYAGIPKKPYMEQLYSLGGQNVLRDQVEDHPHHHGLMFAVSVNGVSFWEESETGGKQIHKTFTESSTESKDGHSLFRLGEALEWQDTQGNTLLRERRRILCSPRMEDNVVFLRWISTLRCPDNLPSVEISGAHYYGLGMRFPKSMDEIGTFTNSESAEGTIYRGEERLTDAKWCFYAVPNTVSVGMFDSPKNPKPCTWFTMAKPFAYLSATLRYHENKIVLKGGESITLIYGLAATDKVLTEEEMAGLYEKWVKSDI